MGQAPGPDWARVQEIFLGASDLPVEGQCAYLDAVCGADAELRAEVESLLQAGAADDWLSTAVGSEAIALLRGSPLEGKRLGSYRVIREISRGGMGAIYLAERADDEFHKQVAIKVVKLGMDTAEVLSRFRHERQILARLEHPYIARLLDGGTTSEGRPYFVMEHVEGVSIDEYCSQRKLGLEARLRLLQRVCEAVSYAHQNLVVHRDLKPDNILVTNAGIPKLLDFGVAKLLAPSGDTGLTVTSFASRPLTPEYASPEQVEGMPVTTATDVYALGVVLYELLTDTKAQRMNTSTPLELHRVVCESEAPRPSVAARAAGVPWRIDDDLDNIVMMALRKEPERRYPSPDRLREDIDRHFAGLTVHARDDSFRYRAAKFFRRHALSTISAAAIFLAMATGAAIALHQAQRAERRLHDLVELANKSLYDVEESLSHQEGATATRREVVQTTLNYLDRLAADESSDRELSVAVVSGYLKMGDVLGRPRKPNLGLPQQAIASYRKAWALMDRIGGWRDSREGSLLWTLIGDRIAVFEIDELSSPAALATLYKVIPEGERLAARYPADTEVLSRLADLYQVVSDAEATRRVSTSVAYSRKAVALYERLLGRDPGSEDLLVGVGSVYSQLAYSYSASGDLENALVYARKSLETREEQARRHPEDVVLRRDLMLSYTRVGDMLGGPFARGGGGDEKAAYEYYKRAESLAEANASGDPNNREFQDNYAIVLARVGGSAPDKLPILAKAAGMLEDSLRINPKTRINRITLCIVDETMAVELEKSGRLEDALERARSERKEALALTVEQPEYRPAQYRVMVSSDMVARLLVKRGRHEQAREIAREMMRVMAKFEPGTPMNAFYEARSWACLGEVYSAAADAGQARNAFEHARDAWKKVGTAKGPYDAPAELAKIEARLR
jgi:serine/threonine protein kinase